MANWTTLALLGALTACSTAAPPPRGVATSVASPHASFAQYHTFSFGLADPPKAGYEVTPRSLEVERRLRPLVLEALKARGYVANDTNGDFIVKLATGTGELQSPSPERAVQTGLARGYLGIDIYDGPTGAEVWQGSAFAEIDPEKIDDSLLKLGVTHMLADFPPRDASADRSAAAH
jgi:hypothetical protein